MAKKLRKIAAFTPAFLLLQAVSATQVTTAAEFSPLPALQLPAYDYAATSLIIYYGDAGPMLFFSPFDYPAPVSGGLLYEIILRYVPQMEALVLPPANPSHTLDLLADDRFGNRRIGQRLWAGENWLADGEQIAFMAPHDYQRLTDIIMQRYRKAGEPMGDVDLGLAAMTPADLPEHWTPGVASVAKAKARLAPNHDDYVDDETGEVDDEAGAVSRVLAGERTVAEQGDAFSPEAPSRVQDTVRDASRPGYDLPRDHGLQREHPGYPSSGPGLTPGGAIETPERALGRAPNVYRRPWLLAGGALLLGMALASAAVIVVRGKLSFGRR